MADLSLGGSVPSARATAASNSSRSNGSCGGPSSDAGQRARRAPHGRRPAARRPRVARRRFPKRYRSVSKYETVQVARSWRMLLIGGFHGGQVRLPAPENSHPLQCPSASLWRLPDGVGPSPGHRRQHDRTGIACRPGQRSALYGSLIRMTLPAGVACRLRRKCRRSRSIWQVAGMCGAGWVLQNVCRNVFRQSFRNIRASVIKAEKPFVMAGYSLQARRLEGA